LPGSFPQEILIYMRRPILLLSFVSVLACVAVRGEGRDEPQWWRGNTHTHTLWSDGDGAPELVADWYRSQGYHFLVLSDHNVLSEGERWVAITEKGPLRPGQIARLNAAFGAEHVEVRAGATGDEMRLATLDELRGRFEVPGGFRFIQGEEVTSSFGGAPVHVNGLGLVEFVEPMTGTSVLDTMLKNIEAIHAQGERLGEPVLAHLDHPNFGWGITVEELARIPRDGFFEVYNGHPAVRNHGDGTHPSTERMWDIALTRRLTDLNLGLLYGVASDDTHHYFTSAPNQATPGRGWVCVRSSTLEPHELIRAMRRGDFYSSSGVELEDVRHDAERLVVDIKADMGVEYTTQFIGTRRGAAARADWGVVLEEAATDPAVYCFRGDELYVRAKVISTRAHPNPHAAGDMESAWVQPVLP